MHSHCCHTDHKMTDNVMEPCFYESGRVRHYWKMDRLQNAASQGPSMMCFSHWMACQYWMEMGFVWEVRWSSVGPDNEWRADVKSAECLFCILCCGTISNLLSIKKQNKKKKNCVLYFQGIHPFYVNCCLILTRMIMKCFFFFLKEVWVLCYLKIFISTTHVRAHHIRHYYSTAVW